MSPLPDISKNTSLARLSFSEASTVWLISANDLHNGYVVYLTPVFDWSRELSVAFTIGDKSTALSHLANIATDESTVVSQTLVEAGIETDGTLSLLHYRDRIREAGPTPPKQIASLNLAQ